MIERFFREGLRYRWSPPGASGGGLQDGSIVDSIQAPTPMTYLGMSDVVDPTLLTARPAGLSLGMTIPYDWCDYALGRTARKHSGVHDVLTGPMSGCFIVRWFDQLRRQTYVGHLGTVNNPTVDTQVKRKFGAVMSQTTTGFNPFLNWTGNTVQIATRHAKTPKFYALVTTTGDFYTILMLQDQKKMDEFVCGGSQHIAGLNYPALRQRLGLPNVTIGSRRN